MSRKGMFDRIIAQSGDEPETPGETLTSMHRRMSAAIAPTRRVNEVVADARGRINSAAEFEKKAEELEKLLKAGDRVVEIDPALVDPSPIRDRLPRSEEEDREFTESIREVGQQIPALLRKNPAAPDRYLTIFGHRRTRAAAALGRPLKAVVVDMNDEDAFVAQGVENNEREDLSYVERALFAQRLTEAGVKQKAVAHAIGTSRPNVVTMIGLVTDLPMDLLLAVGRSPAIGRPRWDKLKEAFEAAEPGFVEGRWREAIGRGGFAQLDDVGRFEAVLEAIGERAEEKRSPGAAVKQEREILDTSGVSFAKVAHSRSGEARWTFRRDKDISFRADGIAFSDWLEGRIETLRGEWRSGK